MANQYEILVFIFGAGLVSGAFVGWILGPRRGLALLGQIMRRLALIPLGLLLLTFFVASQSLLLLARGSLAAVLGLFLGGLTQTLAMAMTERGFFRGESIWTLALILSLWALLLTLVLFIPYIF